MMGTMIRNILQTSGNRGKADLCTNVGVPMDRVRSQHVQKEERRMNSAWPPFVRPGALHAPTYRPYLPTPPLGQDMTQGQFLSGVEQV